MANTQEINSKQQNNVSKMKMMDWTSQPWFNRKYLSGDGIDPPPPEGWCPTVTIYGFKCKEYKVTTDDGYILSVLRIPEGRAGPGGNGIQPRQPVLLQHGLFVDGMTWLLNSPDQQSLAMVLADNGYDVWISNFRGTRFSRQHVTLSPNQPEYWNWTWVDLANHDIPAVIGFVFKETGQQIHYVGHSMGTEVALASLSEGKFQNVKSATLLSPVAHMSHATNPIAIAIADLSLGEVAERIGVVEFNLQGPVANYILKAICANADCTICTDFITAFFENDCCLNKTTAQTFLENYLQPSATKNVVHFAQNIRTGVMSKFDYGNENENMVHYGAASPPIYNLTEIPTDFPLFVSYGGKDNISAPQDVVILLDDLKTHNRDKLQVQFIQQYSHFDFIIGVNANDLLYTRIIDFFRKIN